MKVRLTFEDFLSTDPRRVKITVGVQNKSNMLNDHDHAIFRNSEHIAAP